MSQTSVKRHKPEKESYKPVKKKQKLAKKMKKSHKVE